MKTELFKVGKDVEIQNLLGGEGEWLGLGGVKLSGTALRNPSRPVTLRIDTPEGYLYHSYKYKGTEALPGGAAKISLAAVGKHMDAGEYFDDYGQAVVWLEPYSEKIEDELTIELRPTTLEFGGRSWNGFSYRFIFKSSERSIHRILSHATWEIGGRITGNTVLHQGQCNMPVYRGSKGSLFTTACLRTLDQYGKPQGNSFQLGPRAGLLQGFDFQFSKDGALFQYWPKYDSVSSLLESKKGEDILHLIDEIRFPLTRNAATIEKHVLFTEGPLADHEGRDLWWEARRMVYGSLQRRFGVKETAVVPEIAMIYRTELSPKPLKSMSKPGETRLRMNIGGEFVDHAEVPYAIAERILPAYAAQGVKRFFPEVMSESDVTQLGMRRKLDAGIHGDLHCSSVCATHRFFPSEFWGGVKAWRHMADKAHKLGMEVGAWFAPHLSPRSPIFQEHPEYRMIDVCGLPAGGGYGFQTITVADWNTGIRKWVLDDIRRWHDEGGLDYLFVDSYSNMGMLQVNYAEKFRTNFKAFAETLSDIQKIGIRSFSFESVSAFGASRFGVADLRGDLMEQNRAVAGQNDFGWWVGEEDMMFDVWQHVVPRRRKEAELEKILFRAMAAGGYICFSNYGLDHKLPAWNTRLNMIFNQAAPFMKGAARKLLPGNAGITWNSAKGSLIWTFKDYALPQKPRQILELDGSKENIVSAAKLPAWGTYLAT